MARTNPFAPKLEEVDERKERVRSHMERIYEKNQEFFKAKFKKKYEEKTIKLYRGVGLGVVDTYIPGALESWTTQISTAKKFADMMSRDYRDYTIMTAEVPIQHIFGSFESFGDYWPGEEDLKGKKEYIVMGGTFATTPIYAFDVSRKTEIDKLKTFKEWTLYEGKNSAMKTLKIVTPSMKDFKKVLASGKAAKGVDKREQEIKSSDKT